MLTFCLVSFLEGFRAILFPFYAMLMLYSLGVVFLYTSIFSREIKTIGRMMFDISALIVIRDMGRKVKPVFKASRTS